MKKIDLLTNPHKEQRQWMFELSIEAGRIDFNDDAKAQEFAKDFKALIDDLNDHSENEELFILPLLKNHFPSEAHLFQHDHPAFKLQLRTLVAALKEVIESHPSDKSELALHFYRLFNQFIGDYLLHLDAEERRILTILDEHCSAEELIGVMIAYKTFREGHEPQKVIEFIKSTVTPLDIDSLKRLYASIKRHAPETVFVNACSLSKDVIDPTVWRQIEATVKAA